MNKMETTIKIIKGRYKNKKVVYVIDIRWMDGRYEGGWLFETKKEVIDFLNEKVFDKKPKKKKLDKRSIRDYILGKGED